MQEFQPLEPRRHLTAGALDPMFGTNGRVVIDTPGPAQFNPLVLAVRDDGKVLLGGAMSRFGAVVRVDANGDLDPSFDRDGAVVANAAVPFGDVNQVIPLPGGGSLVTAFASVGRFRDDGSLDRSFADGGWYRVVTKFGLGARIARQADGRILFAYHADDFVLHIVRLNPDGTRDLTFARDTGGDIFPGIGSQDEVLQILVRPDQRILVLLRTAETSPNTGRLALLQFRPDGSTDPSFGQGGRVIGRIFGGNEFVSGIALDPPGRILVSGVAANAAAVARFKANGRFDRGFAQRGVHRIPIADIPQNFLLGAGPVVVAPGGKILTSALSGFGNYVARLNPDGSADTTFGAAGVAKTLGEFALLRDGRILAASPTADGFELERLTPAGAIDTSFSAAGHKLLNVIASGDELATSTALQPDGKLLIFGNLHHGSTDDPVVLRFNRDGSPDASFGSRGRTRVDFGRGSVLLWVRDMAVLPSGKIVVAGIEPRYGDGFVARLNPDGSQDRTYGSNGTVRFPSALNHLVPVPGGGGDDFLAYQAGGTVSRFRADGTWDDSFGDGGYTILDDFSSTDSPNALIAQPDGKILLAGTTSLPGKPYSAVAAMRLNPDGSPDRSFGDAGRVSIDLGGFADAMNAIALQPDGKIVLAGHRGLVDHTAFTVIRLTAAGRLDRPFGKNGIASTDFPADPARDPGQVGDSAAAVAVLGDGRIVAVGTDKFTVDGFGRARIGIARYNPDGSADLTFGDLGRVVTPHDFEIQPLAALPTDDGRLAVIANNHAPFTGDDIVVLRYLMSDPNPLTARVEDGVLKITGTAAADTIRLRPAGGRLAVTGVAQTFALGSFSKIQIDALAGDDTIDAAAAPTPLVISGGDGNDLLLGGAEADSLSGGDGHDTIFGGTGADTLHGDADNDYLNPGPGADSVFGDAGNDQVYSLDDTIDEIDGGPGFDRAKRDLRDPIRNAEGLLA